MPRLAPLRTERPSFAQAEADAKLADLRAAHAERQLAYRRGYVHGWRWGTVCGCVAGGLVTSIGFAALAALRSVL